MIIGLIPARSGSKSVKDKNIRLLGGYPLMAWSIAASKMCGHIERTVVSTDSIEYAGIAAEYGAEVLMRPSKLAQDTTADVAYIKHTLDEMPEVDIIVLLRPTTPLRDPKVIDYQLSGAWVGMEGGLYGATGARSVHKMSETAFKSLRTGANTLIGMWRGASWMTVDEANVPRQMLPVTYHPNGYLDVIRRKTVVGERLFGDCVMPIFTEFTPEIDTEDDFDYIEWRLQKYGSVLLEYLRNSRKV